MRRLLAMLIWVVAQSQAPVPRDGDAGKQQRSAPDQRGTEQSPLVVKAIPAAKTQEETRREAAERQEQVDAGRKLLDYNGRLAAYTKILAGVAFLQLLVFGYQAYKLRQTVDLTRTQSAEQAAAMLRANTAAEASAQAASQTVVTMAAQQAAMEAQAKTTAQTLDHLQREFLATHGPELILRSLVLEQELPEDRGREDQWCFGVKFRLVNVGQAIATLTAISTTGDLMQATDALSVNRLQTYEPEVLASPELIEPGGSYVGEATLCVPLILKTSLRLGMDKSEVLFFGRVVYYDDRNTRRELGFCRRYNFRTDRLVVVTDPEYHYSD